MTGRLRSRPGSALLLALLVIVVMDCVVLGTVHLALLERRVADNAQAALALRLEAESAARSALAHWTAELDSAAIGAAPALLIARESATGLQVTARGERLAELLFLIRAEARQPLPLPGRAAALLLLTPPALPPGMRPATAGLHARGTVSLHNGGTISVPEPPADCAGPDDAGLRLRDFTLLDAPPDGVTGGVALLSVDADVVEHLDRLLALAASAGSTGVRIVRGDTVLTAPFSGVLIVAGSLEVDAVAAGLLVVGGDLTVAPGAAISGAVHVAGATAVAGRIQLDACVAEAVIDEAALRLPAPAPGRAWLPAF